MSRPVASCFQPGGTVLAAQTEDADAGPIALLGVWPALQDQLGQLGGAGTNRCRIETNALERPLGISPMGTGHVLGNGCMPAATGAAQMHRDALAFAEQLERVGGDARVELLADQPVRHRVIVRVDIDVIIARDAADPPLGIFVRLSWQRLKRRAVEFEEQIAAADAEATHWPGIEVGDQFADCLVELAEREETTVPQACQYPALDDQHADLNLGLVARAPRPCWQDCRAVMGRQVEIGSVEPRFVPVGAGDADLWVVGHQLCRHATHEGKRADMRADPVGQRLRPARFGIGVAGGAHHRDEDLGCPDLAGASVVQFDSLPGIVDEHAFAGRVRLPHGRRQPALPTAIELTPAAVAVAAGLPLPVLLPQQRQGDTGTAQLVVDVRPVRFGFASRAALRAGASIKHRFQNPVAQRGRQRPAKFCRRQAIERHRHRAARNPQRSGDRPVCGTALVLEAQDLSYASHRHSLGWHRSPRSS